jgi:hypothetical protein
VHGKIRLFFVLVDYSPVLNVFYQGLAVVLDLVVVEHVFNLIVIKVLAQPFSKFGPFSATIA